MAELTGILSKLSGSAGRFTFKRVNGHTIHHEREGVDCCACPKMAQQQWKGNPKPVCEGSQSAPHKAHGHISHIVMAKKFEIRNSTAEFLTFVAEGKEQGIQVLYKDETVWATQKAMVVLFDCSADNIGLHLKNIYDSKELAKEATTEKISVVQLEGAREVRRNTLFYNLDAIISVGYRVNSIRATQFRQWCT